MLEDHPRQRWSHLRAQTQPPSAFVLKTVKLLADFIPCLADVEFLVFENTGVVLLKTGLKGYFTPDIKKPVALTHLFRKKIACALDRLKVHGSNQRKKEYSKVFKSHSAVSKAIEAIILKSFQASGMAVRFRNR